ncbi:uncharacterized protein N7458_011553 [Penicillium daleae]|uniref:Uncharacterized protein n=1 Tax=Penicillium daleae TaxID=63821 RepID=A0AAD6BSH0_9EURO|nr:uncharacterized protein N7458_011553 [Penicillium daleae]KAJ5432397.1 hypothetical protein N7458_011553 [Penicillium daleae]
MTTPMSIKDVADEVYTSDLASYVEYGIPVGTFIPDSEFAPSPATTEVIMRYRRLVFFTFDELGNPQWEVRELNVMGEPMSEVCPDVVTFIERDCHENRNTDLFSEFRVANMEIFERTAFKYLAKKHRLNEEWNWPDYNTMRAEPYRRSLRQVQVNRMAQSIYTVPTWDRNGVDDVPGREKFLKGLEGIFAWEMKIRYDINGQYDAKSVEYTRERFLLAARSVDLLQKLLHDTEIECVSNRPRYAPLAVPNQNRSVQTGGFIVSPFTALEDPFSTPFRGQQTASTETPGSGVSPYPVPNAPHSTPVRGLQRPAIPMAGSGASQYAVPYAPHTTPVYNQQGVSSPTHNRTLERVAGKNWDLFLDKMEPQANPITPTNKRAFDIMAGDQSEEVPWYAQTSPGYLATLATQEYPGPNAGAQVNVSLWDTAQPSPGFSECSTNIMPIPEGTVNPQALENHAPALNSSHVSHMVIPIGENQRIRIDVSREFDLPFDQTYPGPSFQ